MKRIIAVSAICLLAIIPSSARKMKFVNLGLSVKWAACDLGASRPHQVGDYLAWGAMDPQTNYSAFNYVFRNMDGQITKYSDEDGLTCLEKSDDAASVRLGKGCRIPTGREFEELCTKCKIEWCVKRKVAGAKFTGPNGKSIFIPAVGQCNGTYPPELGREIKLWTSDRSPQNQNDAFIFLCRTGFSGHDTTAFRYVGLQIRPVK